jgi:hypothetical protein
MGGRVGRGILLAVVAGLLLRLAFGFGYWVGKPLTHDEREYLALAANLAQGRGFTYPPPAGGEPEPERFGRAPAYPLGLAALLTVFPGPDPLATIKAAQAIVGALGVWLVAAIAMRAAGPGAARTAAWLAALYPPLVWIPAFVLSETVYMALALANVLIADRLFGDAGARRGVAAGALACGLLAGLAALTRPAHLFFVMLLALTLLARRRVATALLVGLGALLVIAPWTARNWREYGRPVLIASEGGITFWTGNHPLSPGEGDMAANPAIKRDNQRLRAAHPGLTPEQLEPIYYREAMAAIARDPAWWLGLLARKAFYTVVPIGPSYTLHSPRHLVASVASYVLVLAAGLAGAAALLHARRWPVSLGLLLASAVLVCLVFFPQERFRIPVIDPALIVLASARRGLAPAARAPGRLQ